MCGVINIAKQIPVYRELKKWWERDFPTLPHTCPVKPGPNYAYNISISSLENYNTKGILNLLPNGIYKFVLTISDDTDPMSYQLTWIDEIRNRLGEEEF